MLTAIVIILCLILLLLGLYLLQALAFAYKGFVKQSGYYKGRFYKKIIGIVLLFFLIMALNEFSKVLG